VSAVQVIIRPASSVIVRPESPRVIIKSVTGPSGAAAPDNLAELRRWHRELARVRTGLADSGRPAATTDVLVVGDSITEGWTGSGASDSTASAWPLRVARLLARSVNTAGRTGRWVAASANFYTSPKFSAMGTASQSDTGLSLWGRSMPAGAAEAVLITAPTDRIEVQWRERNVFASGDILIRAYAVSSTTVTVASGSQVLAGATSLTVPANSLTASGACVVTVGTQAAIVTYTGGGGTTTLTGVDTSNSTLTMESGATIAQATLALSSQLQTYDDTLAAFEQSVNVWDTGAVTRGVYAVGVQQVTRGGFTGSALWDGCYYFDGDHDRGARVWSAAHFGYNFDSFNDTVAFGLNRDYLGAVRAGVVDPSLVVIAHGTNTTSTDPADTDTKIRQMVTDITDACTVAGTPTPSFALLVPPSSGTKVDATWATIRAQYAATGAAIGAAVWDWAELTGSISDESGDPFTWSDSGNVHPLHDGQRTIGDFVFHKMMEGTSPVIAVENMAAYLQTQIDSTITPKPPLVPITNTASATLTTSMVALANGLVYLDADDWTIPAGLKLQARAVLTFTGHNSADVLGVELYDNATVSVVIPEGTVTATNASLQRAATAWADVPTTPWQAVIRTRNQTAGRGAARTGWIELRFADL
jgi:hypothetical protein